MISFYFEDYKEFDLEKDKISSWIERVVGQEDWILGELSFIFCSDNYLLNMNREHLNHNYYTDVITFDYTKGNVIAGDVFISIDRVIDNAKQFNQSFDKELLRIIIHGVLHLLGFKDKSEDEKLIMTSKEDESLKLF